MRLAIVIAVAAAGIALTLVSAARMWRASRRGAPNELVLGYVALMVAAAVATMLLLRWL